MPTTPTHYKIVPKELFYAASEVFQPNHTYLVTASVYQGLVDGGSTSFADKCDSAEPIVKE